MWCTTARVDTIPTPTPARNTSPTNNDTFAVFIKTLIGRKEPLFRNLRDVVSESRSSQRTCSRLNQYTAGNHHRRRKRQAGKKRIELVKQREGFMVRTA